MTCCRGSRPINEYGAEHKPALSQGYAQIMSSVPRKHNECTQEAAQCGWYTAKRSARPRMIDEAQIRETVNIIKVGKLLHTEK